MPTSRTEIEPTLSVEVIKFRLGIAERFGGCATDILLKADINPDKLTNPANRITCTEECRIWKQIVISTGREDIGLLCGESLPIQVASVVGFVMMNSPSLLVAVEKMVAYQKLIGDSMGLNIRHKGEHSFIEIQLWSAWRDELRYTMDLMAAAVQSWIKNNSVNQSRAFRVGFIYPDPVNRKTYQNHFSPAPVDFGVATTYLVYSTEALAAPVLCANSSMFTVFDVQARDLIANYEGQNTLSWKVRQLVTEKLDGSPLTLDQAASKLAMSTRSLQGKLKQESTSFQAILNQSRREVAETYIREGLAGFAEIAFILGYSEVSAFSRSFKSWTGLSPSEFATIAHQSR